MIRMNLTNSDSRIDYELPGERRNHWRWHSVLPAMPTAGQQSYMTGVDRKPSGGYGTHSVLRYSVIPLVEHDIALLKEIEVGFHFPWRCYRSSSLC